MTGRFPFTKQAKYPHMKPEDVAIWERFLAKRPGYFDSVDYDIPLGKGAPVNPAHPENIQADQTILSQKKVDAVGYIDGVVCLVEVKPIADMRGLGQILTYAHLYQLDHPGDRVPLKLVVAGALERELEEVYYNNGIEIEIA